MKKQKGAALIVVLSLLAVSLMIGLMSMQSSQVDERLAGNYKAAAEAQMAAEFGAAYGMAMLGTPGYFGEHDSGEACEDFAEAGLSEQERRADYGDVDWYKVDDDDIDAEIIGCQYGDRDLYLSWGQVRDGGGVIISESFVVFVDGDGDVLTVNDSPSVSNPLVCLRSAEDGCGWNDEDVADYFDGRPHPVPADFDCQGSGQGPGNCPTDPIYDGDEKEVAEYDPGAKEKWVDFLSGLFFDEFQGGGRIPQGEIRSDGSRVYRNIEIASGEVSRESGNTNTAGIIFVRSGATFRGHGTGHHEGLIVVEDGGALDLYNNYNVYGAVVALGDITLDVGNGGQGGVRYHANSSGEGAGGFVWEIL